VIFITTMPNVKLLQLAFVFVLPIFIALSKAVVVLPLPVVKITRQVFKQCMHFKSPVYQSCKLI